MIDASILSTLAGVTTVIGVVCVLAYLFILKGPEPTNLSITDVLGHRHDPVALNELLKAFPTEEGKLKALRARLSFDRNQAVDLLGKVQSRVSVDSLNELGAKSRDKRFFVTACLFFALATIALISQFILSGGGGGSNTGVGPAASAASATLPAAASATLPAASAVQPTYAWEWKKKRPGGTLYSKAFVVTTENRHNRSNAGASGTIRVTDLPDPQVERRIYGAEYSCVGDRCGWSKNPAGQATGDYAVDPNGQWITWRRSWDGDPVDETNTVFYEVYTRSCTANCP